MDFEYQEALRKTRLFLVDNIIFDSLYDHLIVQDIFPESILASIRHGPSQARQIRTILDHLIKRPNSCFHKFLTALNDSGHQHCAQSITKNYIPPVSNGHHGYSPDRDLGFPETVSSEDDLSYPQTVSNVCEHKGSQGYITVPVQESSSSTEELALDVSPSFPSQSEITQDRTAVTNHSLGGPLLRVGNGSTMTEYQQQLLTDPHGVYRMDSSPRGMALIISNENFQHLSPRKGTKADMASLHVLFKNLGFHVCHQVDKTAKEMRELLTSFAKHKLLDHVHSLAVVVMSHGGSDGIICGVDKKDGSDESYITEGDIMDIYSSKNCPKMAQKPKLFIIQACRGRRADRPDEHSPADMVGCRSMREQHSTHGVFSQMSNASSTTSSRIASMADMCLVHSAVPGFAAYRHHEHGSHFIQALASVFLRHSAHRHVTDMMIAVTRKLAGTPLQQDLRTVPCVTLTLRKNWFLNPVHCHD